jgi:hypothetical protein
LSSFSISVSVRCSRVRISAFGRLVGVTARFLLGATSFRCNLAIEFRLPAKGTVRRIGRINSVQHLHEATALPKSTIVRLCGPSLLFLDGGGQA